jgi:hypothetical protein
VRNGIDMLLESFNLGAQNVIVWFLDYRLLFCAFFQPSKYSRDIDLFYFLLFLSSSIFPFLRPLPLILGLFLHVSD